MSSRARQVRPRSQRRGSPRNQGSSGARRSPQRARSRCSSPGSSSTTTHRRSRARLRRAARRGAPRPVRGEEGRTAGFGEHPVQFSRAVAHPNRPNGGCRPPSGPRRSGPPPRRPRSLHTGGWKRTAGRGRSGPHTRAETPEVDVGCRPGRERPSQGRKPVPREVVFAIRRVIPGPTAPNHFWGSPRDAAA